MAYRKRRRVHFDIRDGCQNLRDQIPNRRKVRSCFTLDENKLTQVESGDKTTTTVREFTPEEVKVTTKVGDIVCVRIFKLLN